MAEIFPVSWLRPEALSWVLDFLENLPVSAKQKKHALYEWSEWAGVELTAEMVERVTGLPAGEV